MLNAVDDEHVFVVGDVLDKVSALFGQYPKTGQLVAVLGRIAATQVAARGATADRSLPESTCYVINRPEPKELTRIESSYRFRGDGVIQQSVRQQHDPQAGEADLDWARRQFAELFGTAG